MLGRTLWKTRQRLENQVRCEAVALFTILFLVFCTWFEFAL